MTKSKKIILSLSVVTPIAIGSTILLTSCAKTYPIVTPQPINLNSEILNKINEKLVETNSKLNSMTNFSDVFKFQSELLAFFKTSNNFNFGINLENVKINIKPSYLDNQWKYNFRYEIEFKPGINIDFESNNNFEFQNNKLLSKEQLLDNATLNSQNNAINLWFTNSQSLNTNSYFNFILNNDSLEIQYNDLKNNITENLVINNSILNIDNINIYVENVVNITTGEKWLQINSSSEIDLSSDKTINVNIKYIKNNNQSLAESDQVEYPVTSDSNASNPKLTFAVSANEIVTN